MKKNTAVFIALIAMVSIQSGASLAKQLFPIMGITTITFLRLSIAAALLIAVFRPWKAKFTRSEWRSILAYGISLGFMNFLFYLALARIPLGITVTLEFLGPLAVALSFSRRIRDFFWAVLAIAGIVLILSNSWKTLFTSSSILDPLGIVYALGAGSCWAFYILCGKKAGASVHSGKLVAIGTLVGALAVSPLCLIGNPEIGNLSLNAFSLAAAVAILSSALPYFLEMRAMQNLPLRTFGILMSLDPALAALSGFVFLREHLSFTEWAAIACIIAASIGSSSTAKDFEGV